MSEIQWHYPKTVAEAVTLLDQLPGRAVPVAGATALGLRKKIGAAHLIDLRRCKLAFIRSTATKITIGAMTRLADILPPVVPGPEGAFFARVAGAVATSPLRNCITVGGNLARPLAWSDLPIVCMALDARLVLRSVRSTRRVLAGDYFSGAVDSRLESDEIVSAVEIPRRKGGHGWGYEQLKRTATDYSLLTIAAWVTGQNDRIKKAKIIAGAVGPRPVDLVAAAKELRGAHVSTAGKLSAECVRRIKEIAMDEASPRSDMRASIEYRRKMVGVLVERAVERAVVPAQAE